MKFLLKPGSDNTSKISKIIYCITLVLIISAIYTYIKEKYCLSKKYYKHSSTI